LKDHDLTISNEHDAAVIGLARRINIAISLTTR